MSTYNFVLNSTNVVGTSNSSFLYKFPNGSLKVPAGSQMGISQITLPYSFFNWHLDIINLFIIIGFMSKR